MKSLLPLAAASFLFTAAASATTLFSDLGTGNDVYQSQIGWAVAGSGAPFGESTENEELFTVAGTGSEIVGQIDLGVVYVSVLRTFSVSIWTDVSNAPGSQVANASWIGTTSQSGGTCCGLVTIANITGVALNGGAKYFIILAPVSFSNSSDLSWEYNSEGVTGYVRYSNNAGQTWSNENGVTEGAFDILGAPEPGSLLMLAIGITGLTLARRRKRTN
jgi:hypothetical protein